MLKLTAAARIIIHASGCFVPILVAENMELVPMKSIIAALSYVLPDSVLGALVFLWAEIAMAVIRVAVRLVAVLIAICKTIVTTVIGGTTIVLGRVVLIPKKQLVETAAVLRYMGLARIATAVAYVDRQQPNALTGEGAVIVL